MNELYSLIITQTIQFVCEKCEVPEELLYSPTRRTDVSQARHCIVYSLRTNLPRYSWQEIAGILKRTHATAISSFEQASYSLDGIEDSAFKKNVRDTAKFTARLIQTATAAIQ